MANVETKVLEVSDVIRQLKHILVEDMQVNLNPDDIPDNYSLLETGLALDSILIVELITRIEDRFGVEFEDQRLDAELFNNLSLLGAFVAREAAAGSVQDATQRNGGATC